MRVLVVGGAGKIGTMIREALMAEHDCYCFDLERIDELGNHSIVADTNDQQAVKDAVAETEGIIYLPMRGYNSDRDKVTAPQDHWAVGKAFDTHIQGYYRFLCEGLAAGARNFVYASTLSVYDSLNKPSRLNETMPADGFGVYAITKRLGEQLCITAAQYAPDACIVALRLAFPVTEDQMDQLNAPSRPKGKFPLRTQDLSRLFLAALACSKPGAHIVQATGDLEGQRWPNTRVTELLGWKPQGF